jgi:hypothetical protein
MKTVVVVIFLGVAAFIFNQIEDKKLIEITILDVALYTLALVFAAPGVFIAAQPLKDPDPYSNNDLFDLMPILGGVLVMFVVLNF